MSPSNGLSVAEHLYARSDDQALLDHARAFWRSHGPADPESAEVARFARVAAFRSGSADDDLWQARAVAAACTTGAWRSLALSLQQYFYRLLGRGEHEAAEGVLEEMERLAEHEHEGPPEKDLVSGILAERRALLLTDRGEWSAALTYYKKALDLCPQGTRRSLKVRGGLARSEWLAGGDHEVAANEFKSLASESKAFPDVRNAALTNVAAAKAEDRSGSVPFDLV